jgi:hypothetical protein
MQGMQISPLDKGILGGFFIIVGLVMTILHKQVQEFHEDWFAGVPWVIRQFWPRGPLLTAIIILFGVLSVIAGIALLAVSIAQQ